MMAIPTCSVACMVVKFLPTPPPRGSFCREAKFSNDYIVNRHHGSLTTCCLRGTLDLSMSNIGQQPMATERSSYMVGTYCSSSSPGTSTSNYLVKPSCPARSALTAGVYQAHHP